MRYFVNMMPISPRRLRGRLATLLPLLVPLFAVSDAAAQAQLFMHPTLVMFSGTERSATVNVVNQGDATGVFELAWVDFEMTRDGGLLAREGTAPWSLQPFARYSPRRVTLRPGETQIVRIALRSGGEVAEAEYYSHLKVVTLEDDLGAAAGEADAAEAVMIEARSAIAIPVIWRNSDAEPRAAIESVRLDPAGDALVIELRRAGKLSTRGFLHVLAGNADYGESQQIADPVPLVIYPSAERRTVTVPLKIDPDGVAGARVIYAQERELTSRSSYFDLYEVER